METMYVKVPVPLCKKIWRVPYRDRYRFNNLTCQHKTANRHRRVAC